MNPILPKECYVPDVEARVWDDARLYLYGSMDTGGDVAYCSRVHHVFSSTDMEQWTDHGQCLSVADIHESRSSRLYAPDAMEIDGRYYLFYCGNIGSEGVAHSTTPTGPFTDARPVAGADGDGIDPAIFKDDDGALYFLWGQFSLRGARLDGDRNVDRSTMVTGLLTEEEHGFHEGASLRKVGDTYYLIYTDISRGKATCLSYATSDKPLGPYQKSGVIIDNTGCDPARWNNHGSIASFRGTWYVFYHRSSRGTNVNRRVCVEPITIAEDGSIPEVRMTTVGASPPLPATEPLDAFRACELHGVLHTVVYGPEEAGQAGTEWLGFAESGDWAAYRSIDFGDGVREVAIELASAIGGGQIQVRIDHPLGACIARVAVPATGGYQVVGVQKGGVEVPVRGVHEVYLCVGGGMGRICDLKRFWFA